MNKFDATKCDKDTLILTPYKLREACGSAMLYIDEHCMHEYGYDTIQDELASAINECRKFE